MSTGDPRTRRVDHCDAKRSYKTKAAALAVVKRMKRRVVDPFRLRVYQCDRCHRWHVANAPFTVAPDDVG